MLWRRITIALVVAVALIWLIAIWRHAWNWAQTDLGFRRGDSNSPAYLFWSGFGGDLAYLGIFFSAVIYYRKSNCKRRWCPLIGQHEFTDPTDGVTRNLCWLHHPDVRHRSLTPETIAKIHEKQKRHRLHLGKQPGKG